MIKRPVLIIDENKCRNNIKRMVRKAASNDLIFRPHFKTHQSLEIGRWFKEYGVDKITVSSVSMAEYFCAEWNDITIAFPVNILEIDEINSLAKKISLNLLLESGETALYLEKNTKYDVGIFLKIDVGYHRTGIHPRNLSAVDSILDTLTTSDKLSFKGFLSHAGHTYNCRNKSEIIDIHNESIDIMDNLKGRYIQRFPELITSLGDTPGCSLADSFGNLDEIRPGNFVFYDLVQQQLCSCKIEDIAVAMACPVVAVHEDQNELVIYCGGVHLSKESMNDDNYGLIYGKVVAIEYKSWNSLVSGSYVTKLSQEHGVVHLPDSEISNYNVGDIILILPVHSCMTANLMHSYQTMEGRVIDRL